MNPSSLALITTAAALGASSGYPLPDLFTPRQPSRRPLTSFEEERIAEAALKRERKARKKQSDLQRTAAGISATV